MKISVPKIKWLKKKEEDEINFVPNFSRDWKLIVITFFVLTLVVFVTHFLIYWWLEGVLLSGGEARGEKARNQLLNHAAYENALTDIREKQEKFSEYLNQAPSLVDPSL